MASVKTGPLSSVHEICRLHISADRFFIEPTDGSQSSELLVIDRISQEISLQKNDGQIPSMAEKKIIYGLFGIIRLLAGPYLVVITNRKKIGEINGHPIYKVTGTEVLTYKKTTLHMNETQIQDNSKYLVMVEHVLALESYYFSPSYDLTHTIQRLHNTSPEFLQMPLHERADMRFVWNGHLLRELVQQQELNRFCIPILHGFISIRPCTIGGKAFSYTVISRRSCFRAGTRFYMRGVDIEGHAANYVETEQMVECEKGRSSYVQVRGSVPLIWSQYPNLKYKPKVFLPMENQNDGFQRHFAAQIYNYGKQVILNLLDQKGMEDQLVKAYGNAVTVSQNTQIRYIAFDFHKECSKMRWHRLSLLIDKIRDDMSSFGYFLAGQDGIVMAVQEGVFRTNCIDCLDRTNVVQSMLAHLTLQNQLVRLGILSETQRVEDQTAVESTFKHVWADNADACSKQYAGTGALKTDFTRTGKRTRLGLLWDGWNSMLRYYLNNFIDGFRQDSIDLFLGNYQVEETEGISKPSPFRQPRDWKFYAMPAIFLVAFSMCMISLLIPDENPSEQLLYVLFWGGASAVTLGVMYLFGQEFVDRPKLASLKSKVE